LEAFTSQGETMTNVAVAPNGSSVLAHTFPYDQWHDRYQEYYLAGLRQYLASQGVTLRLSSHTQFPAFLKVLRRVRDAPTLRRMLRSRTGAITDYLDWMAHHSGARHSPAASLVGEYLFCLDALHTTNACIDTHDAGSVTAPSLLERCDVYLKTNYWNGPVYDPRVRPFYNCNPVVLPHIKKLQAMRAEPPVFDLCFVVRVWGGPTGTEGVEHCLRLLEAVAKVKAKKFLLAELLVGDTDAQAQRLRQSGIPTTTGRFGLAELWQVMARSRVNVTRLGTHHCMSWRMTDHLALGACTVLDQHPKTIWPVPLVPQRHYVSLNATTSNDDPVADDSAYAAIPGLLEELLSRGDLLADMRRCSAEYFDGHLHPIQIGRQLHQVLLDAMPHAAYGAVSTHTM
jgi:hypothetical protein